MSATINRSDRNNQRGIAMLAVLLALVCLSVIGLGMMFTTNMESGIARNYRDKQVAFYAAMAGLQEARQRIKYPYEIPPPGELPSPSFDNVVYIVADGSTVKPWLTANRYFDTELCQEHVLSLTGTPGAPCGTTASGTSWFRVVDDSLTSAGPWRLSQPDWKWTRIQVKGNNSTPVPVNGNPADTEQACWDGTNQISTPTDYAAGCLPGGRVRRIEVTAPGIGFTGTPTVTIAGGGGSGATATASMTAGSTGYVSAVAVTAGGGGYTSPPTVTFGSGPATATAVLGTTGTTTTTPGSVVTLALTDGGSGYTSLPTVTFSGGGGSGATATAVLSTVGTTTTTGYVNSLSVGTSGSGYTSAPSVTISGGGGSGATATALLGSAGSVKTVSLGSAGTQCYSAATDVVISFVGGGGSGAAASAVLETGKSCIYSVGVTNMPQCSAKLDAAGGYTPIDQKSGLTFEVAGQNKSFSGTLFVSTANDKTPVSVSVQNPGYDATGYSAATLSSHLELSSGAWADCGNINVTAQTGYRIASINVTAGGSGYTSVPTVTVNGGVGSTGDPSATATLGFPITGLSLTSGGSGYTTAPAVTLTGGGGAGASGTSTITLTSTTVYPLAGITLTSGGAGFTSAPAVTISGGGGSGATAAATVSAATITTYPIASIVVTYGGSGYDVSFPPSVTLTGGGGSGALATATVAMMTTGLFMLDHIDVTATGTGYTFNPAVTISGGGGSGATAIAHISGGIRYGKVWTLTSMAQTRSGARSLLQMEVASPVLGFASGGSLTLDGPNPIMDAMPSSNLFYVRGNDANSCSETPEELHPAISAYDDPNADPPTNSVTTITGSLPRPDHYTGSGGTPSIQNGYATLGETMGTPAGLDSLMSAIYNMPGAVHYNSSNVGSFNPSATTNSSINYVDGDLTLSGSPTGRGILVVTGTLTMGGNVSWMGTIFVVGDGHFEYSGGGNGTVQGMLWIAKTWDNNTSRNILEDLASPTMHWNGGGGNGVYYDHCYVTNLMDAVNQEYLISTRPLKVLSFRILPY